MTEIKPCPFCGDTNINLALFDYYLMCGECGIHGPEADSEDDAIVKWNKRVNND